VRFADLRSVTRSLTLSAPISATRALAEIAEDLVRGVLADHRDERTISLLAISVSHLEAHAIVQLELPLGLADEGRRPGTKKGLARSRADRAVDAIRKRFGGQAVDYGSAMRVCAPSLTSSDALLKESFEYRLAPTRLRDSAPGSPTSTRHDSRSMHEVAIRLFQGRPWRIA
jgi:DNA polymerase-4